MKLLTLIATLLLTASVGGASNIGYNLQIELSMDGKVVSRPRIIVAEGELGTMTQESGKNKTYIEVLASEGEIKGNEGILMKLKVGYIQKDGSKTIFSRPQILAKTGEEALIVVGQDGKPEMSLKVIVTRIYL